MQFVYCDSLPSQFGPAEIAASLDLERLLGEGYGASERASASAPTFVSVLRYYWGRAWIFSRRPRDCPESHELEYICMAAHRTPSFASMTVPRGPSLNIYESFMKALWRARRPMKTLNGIPSKHYAFVGRRNLHLRRSHPMWSFWAQIHWDSITLGSLNCVTKI